jgi:hypothetical protein
MQVYNNLVYNNYGVGIEVWGNGSPASGPAVIYNNTIFGSGNVGLQIISSESPIYKNNIIYSNALGNVSDSGSGTVYSNNLTVDPKFINATGNNFRIQSGSPAIDAGANLYPVVMDDFGGGSRPFGPAYDIGAYEYGASN